MQPTRRTFDAKRIHGHFDNINPKEWALAVVLDGIRGTEDCLERFESAGGCPFLAMASDPIGILRALSLRMGKVTPPATLAAFRKVESAIVMSVWHIRPPKGECDN